jgi:hypothetical protein
MDQVTQALHLEATDGGVDPHRDPRRIVDTTSSTGGEQGADSTDRTA